jgi:hypothetical protein
MGVKLFFLTSELLWREQVHFQCDDDAEVHFELVQHA